MEKQIIEAAIDNFYNRLGDFPGDVDVYPSSAVVIAVADQLCQGNGKIHTNIKKQVELFIQESPRFIKVKGRNGGLKRVG